MKKQIALILMIVLSLCTDCSAQGGDRAPSVAGMFYPADSADLAGMITRMFDAATMPPIDGTPLALIVPHAGYIYSGATAAEAYNLLRHSDEIETAIILGFKHRTDYVGAAIWSTGSWRTPLGKAEIDSELAAAILKGGAYLKSESGLFSNEHSLEVQIPFLQVANPKIKIVPIQIGLQNREIIDKLTTTLTAIMKERKGVVLIASTDLSHYHSRAECQKIDARTAAYITALNGDALWQASESGEAELCGAAPVAVALKVSRNLGANQVKILKQTDSGESSGDLSQVVGYISAVTYSLTKKKSSEETMGEKQNYLSDPERKTLLKIARQSIEAWLDKLPVPEFPVPAGKLTEKGAAFVTITSHQQLRGCIGYTEAILPLYQTVSTCAIKAASEDPRFEPLTKAEYKDIVLEISVLTPLEKIDDVNRIEVGKHGLLLQKGYHRGLLLPQVATDYGWDRDTFLDQTCRKAGMPAGCWKEGCDIFIFSAEVFGEEEH